MSVRRTRLLVSVRDVAEAEAALAGGADIIDVKDPARGSLGMAGADMVSAILARCGHAAPVTAAMGELHEHQALPPLAQLPLRYVKLGLAHAGADWSTRLSTLVRPQIARFIAVTYADHARASSPAPRDVLRWAIANRAAGLLIDTFVKDGRGLFDWLDESALRPLLCEAQQSGLLVALAGSLSEVDLARALPLQPDIVAVRGAACVQSDRRASVDARRVAALAALTTARNAPSAAHAG